MFSSAQTLLARPRRVAIVNLAAACCTLVSSASFALDLTVEVGGAAPDKGPVLAAVYGESDWGPHGHPVQGAMATVEGGRAALVYRGLPPGRYAVKAFQDENGNGLLDSNPVGLPLERYGISRNARGRMGPPAFDAAAIDLQTDTTVQLQLR